MGCNRTTLARPWSVHLLVINVNDAHISGSLSRTVVTDIVSVLFSQCVSVFPFDSGVKIQITKFFV